MILELLVEALLFYIACSLIAKSKDDAPGLIRIFVTILILAFFATGIKGVIGDFWLSSAIIFVANLFILWIGLGIGFFRTILAAIIVLVLHSILEKVFATGRGPELFT